VDDNKVETSSLALLDFECFECFERHFCVVLESIFFVVFWILATLDIFPGLEFGGAL
jgi:hypothetical protein